MNFPYFIRNMWNNILSFIRKCLHILFIYVIILFVCLSLYLSFFQKNLQFYQISYVILNYIMHIFDKNLQFYQKCPHFFFNWILFIFIWLSLYLRFFSIFLLILCFLQFYHTYVIWYFSVFMKISNFHFQLHSNCISKSIIAYGFFKKYSIL